jgi:hypothetical protein
MRSSSPDTRWPKAGVEYLLPLSRMQPGFLGRRDPQPSHNAGEVRGRPRHQVRAITLVLKEQKMVRHEANRGVAEDAGQQPLLSVSTQSVCVHTSLPDTSHGHRRAFRT